MSQDLFSDSQLFASEETPNGDEEDGVIEEETEPVLSQLSASEVSHRRNGTKIKLLNTDLPKEVISKHKHVFAQIQAKTKEAENVSDILSSTKLLKEQLERQDKYFKSGGVNENMTLDAKCISTNTSIACNLVKSLNVDTKVFDPMEFADKLLFILNPTINETDDPNESISVDTNDWIEFGRNHCHFHKVLPTLNYIHGSFDSTAESPKQKEAKPRAIHKKAVLSAQVEATQIDPNTKTTEDSTPQEVEHILKTVKKLEAKNPILPYIDVIVNPNSISETVENVFHSAFLVKDGLASLIPDEEDGLPVVASIDNSNIDLSQPESGIQTVFSFSMKDWKYWIERFDIKKPAIRHLKKNSAKS